MLHEQHINIVVHVSLLYTINLIILDEKIDKMIRDTRANDTGLVCAADALKEYQTIPNLFRITKTP